MSQLDTYLFFDGTCAEAMRFYEKALGAKIEMMMTQAETPPSTGMPPGSPDRILHASLKLGDRMLMASDDGVAMSVSATTRPSHGWGDHEHNAGCRLLAKSLAENNDVKVVPSILLTPHDVDKSNYQALVVDSGYIKAEELK